VSNIRTGAQVKAARALLGLTQSEVAVASGLVEEAMNKLGVVFFIVPTIGVRLKGHSEFGM
jgi:transcriptional regulator with XRE-family HTH domain